ncbi:tetratricopeptide repeat protein [Streptomyces sp. MNU76]|nr:tetratricopeptide repeat protein [Streptomyces sp. MNU76]
MADTQDDPDTELAWDLRALSAADELGDGRSAQDRDELAVRAFYPSLHLNLAADYARLGRPDAARSHLRLARGALASLADDGHGDGVRTALARLEARLDETGPTGGETPGPPRQRPQGPSGEGSAGAAQAGAVRGGAGRGVPVRVPGRGSAAVDVLADDRLGVSLPQPPYRWPSAQTSEFFAYVVGTVLGGRDLDVGAGARWRALPLAGPAARRGVAGCGGGRGGVGAGAGGGPDVGFCAGGALGVGSRGGPTSRSASRAGASTIWVSVVPSGRGSDGRDGRATGCRGGGWCGVTQPVRADTATVTRSVAVVVGRCTRATLLCAGPFGEGAAG